jgi:hypothetical protein
MLRGLSEYDVQKRAEPAPRRRHRPAGDGKLGVIVTNEDIESILADEDAAKYGTDAAGG